MTIIDALQQINHCADKAHNRHTTQRSKQLIFYNKKTEQAADYLAARCPNNLSGYPLIKAEINSTNKTGKEVANEIIKSRKELLSISSKIEKLRKNGKLKIYDAGNNIKEVVNQIINELDKL